MTATTVPITAQELFRIMTDDPRVKAYPRLVEALNKLLPLAQDCARRNAQMYEGTEFNAHGAENICNNARALLKELGEIE